MILSQDRAQPWTVTRFLSSKLEVNFFFKEYLKSGDQTNGMLESRRLVGRLDRFKRLRKTTIEVDEV